MTKVRLLAIIGLLAGIAAFAAILNRASAPLRRLEDSGSDPAAGARDSVDSRQQAISRGPSVPGSQTAVTPPSAKSADSGRTGLLGSVVAPLQATLSVRMPARIREVFAREGDTVRAGQTLIELDQAELAAQEQTALAGQKGARAQVGKARAGLSAQEVKADADVATARSGLKQAQTRLQQAILARQAAEDEQKADLRAAREGVRKAELALGRARETLAGLEELAKVGGVSRSDLEGARVQQRVAQSDLDSANAQVERVQNGSGGMPYRVALAEKDVETAQGAVEQARDGIKAAEAARRQVIKVAEQDVRSTQAVLDQASAGLTGARVVSSQTRLTSPLGGLVTSLGARRGETAQPGAPLATIVSMAGLRVDALVPGRLLSLFHVGQRAGVSADTAPGKVFDAVVSEIARMAESDGRTFRVKFRLLDSPPLRPGQSARISVDTGG